MEVHSEYFWGIPEIRGLKPDEVVPTIIILDERQTREGSNVVTVRQYCSNIVRVITGFRVGGRLILPNCEDKRVLHPTEHVGQLSLIVHVKWLLLEANFVICLEILLTTCLFGIQLCN